MRLKYGFFLALIALLAAPVLAQDKTPHVEPASCWMTLPDGVEEGKNIDCGYLIVPEDRTGTSDATIQLAYAVYHASGDNVQPDPIIYLSGGPAGTRSVKSTDGLIHPICTTAI